MNAYYVLSKGHWTNSLQKKIQGNCLGTMDHIIASSLLPLAAHILVQLRVLLYLAHDLRWPPVPSHYKATEHSIKPKTTIKRIYRTSNPNCIKCLKCFATFPAFWGSMLY